MDKWQEQAWPVRFKLYLNFDVDLLIVISMYSEIQVHKRERERDEKKRRMLYNNRILNSAKKTGRNTVDFMIYERMRDITMLNIKQTKNIEFIKNRKSKAKSFFLCVTTWLPVAALSWIVAFNTITNRSYHSGFHFFSREKEKKKIEFNERSFFY